MADTTIPTASEEQASEREPGVEQTPESTDADVMAIKVAELEAASNAYKDQLLRKAAEFENYKKRVENENASMIRYSSEDLIQKLIPIVDDFERMIKANAAKVSAADDAFIKGVELIYSKFKRILESQGVKEFETLGKPFDPNLHDALMQMPKEGVAPFIVIDEVEKGYMLYDKVIRHARVIVSGEPS